MPGIHDYTLQKHKKNVLHSERRIAETAVADGNVVMLGSADWMVVPASANAQALGVALNTVTTEQIAEWVAGGDIAAVEVEVAMIGVVPVIASESIDADDFVIPDTGGQVQNAAGNGLDNIIGKMLKDTDTDEEGHMLIVYCGSTRGQT